MPISNGSFQTTVLIVVISSGGWEQKKNSLSFAIIVQPFQTRKQRGLRYDPGTGPPRMRKKKTSLRTAPANTRSSPQQNRKALC